MADLLGVQPKRRTPNYSLTAEQLLNERSSTLGERDVGILSGNDTLADTAEDTLLAGAGTDVVETAETPRDERCDSIDPATGVLTAEAQVLRSEALRSAE